MAYWDAEDLRLNYAHPPLANAMDAIALRGELDGIDPPLEERDAWEKAYVTGLANGLMSREGDAMDRWRTTARRTGMLWMIGLVLWVGVWCRSRLGNRAALVAAGLIALHPALLAHGRLCTTDLPMTLTATICVCLAIDVARTPGVKRAAACAFALAVMVCTKHSGVPLALMLGLGAAGWIVFAGGRTRRWSLPRRLRFVALWAAGTAALCLLAINAIYRFEQTGWTVQLLLDTPEPSNWISRRFDRDVLSLTPLAELPRHWMIPLPRTYLIGLATVKVQHTMGHGDWFFGPREAGHPLYFPVMLLAKSPAAVVILVCALPGLAARDKTRSFYLRAIAICAGSILLASTRAQITIGVRHILPVMPLICVLAAAAVDRLMALMHQGMHARRSTLLLGLLSASLLYEHARAFPRYLGHYSPLVGGTAGGHRISVVGEDWGQHLGELARYATEARWDRIYYFSRFSGRVSTLRRELGRSGGASTPELVPIRCKYPPRRAGWLVLHLDDWWLRRHCVPYLKGRSPDLVLFDHMQVFRIESPAP